MFVYYSGAFPINNNQVGERHGYVISHADFPKSYTANITSYLMIKDLQPGQIVQIKFLFFDLYYRSGYPGCNDDYLQIITSANDSIRYCSDPAHKPALQTWHNFTVNGTTMALQFITNHNPTVGKGFYFEYRG